MGLVNDFMLMHKAMKTAAGREKGKSRLTKTNRVSKGAENVKKLRQQHRDMLSGGGGGSSGQ